MSEMLEAALRYARMGWAVAPLNGKNPGSYLGGQWQHQVSTFPGAIEEWWKRWPDANVGVLAGEAFWVLDVDVKPDKGVDGREVLNKLVSIHGPLPDTLQQITGGGGRHYFFRMRPELRSISGRKLATHIGQGLETRGYHNIVAVEPSIHPDTGGAYIFDGASEIENQPILDAPQWLVDLILAKAEKGVVVHVGKIPKGTQHDTLVSEAGSLRRLGWEPDKIYQALLARNQDCEEPGPEANIRKIAYSMAKYQAGKPLSDRQKKILSQELFREFNPTAVAVPVLAGADPQWTERLLKNSSEGGKNVVANAELMLIASNEFHDCLRFDEFTGDAFFTRDLPAIRVKAGEVVTDQTTREITVYAQRNMNLEALDKKTVDDGIELVSRRRPTHPVREYLGNLQWDRECRIDTWLTDYAGAADTELNRAIGRRWLISAVARVMEPGCKADCCMVLGGKQGKGKSTLLKHLANGTSERWFSDSEIDFRHKDAYGKIQGVWIYELGEIDSMTKSEAGVMKRFMSSAEDKYRPAYGRRDMRQPRQCVFAGTVNPQEFLNDPTGARRFWTIDIPPTAEIRYTAILSARDQLWAEAVAAYNAGDPWYLDTKELRELAELEAEKHLEIDEALYEKLAMKLHRVQQITTLGVFEDILGYDVKDVTMADQKNVSRVLKLLRFEKKVRRDEKTGLIRKCFIRENAA